MKKLVMIPVIAACLITLLAPTAFADWTDFQYIDDTRGRWLDVIESPDGVLHGVWSRFTSWPYTQLVYSSSLDGGQTWIPVKAITGSSHQYNGYERPRIVLDSSGVLHVSYYRFNYYGYYSVLYHARSVDGGDTWTSTVIDSGRVPVRQSIAIDPSDDNKLYLTWVSDFRGASGPNIYSASSQDGGMTWNSKVLVTRGSMPWAYGFFNSILVDPLGKVHLVTLKWTTSGDVGAHFVSLDDGVTWQSSGLLPADFMPLGIYAFGGELIVTGRNTGGQAFLSSMDWGDSFSAPVVVPGITGNLANLTADGNGTYHAWGANSPYQDKSYVRSSDNGATWSSPDYIGRGNFNEIVWTSSGEILIFGEAYIGNYTYPGFITHYLPYSVDAPPYLSLWEKSSFNYNFDVLGTGQVNVSLPAADIEFDSSRAVTVGGNQVAATVTAVDERVVVSFPVDSADWTDCSVPVETLKGTFHKWQKMGEQVALLQQTAETALAEDEEDGEVYLEATNDIEMLRGELESPESEFVVSILDGGSEVASDKTAVIIYDKATSIYTHFKANPPQGSGAKLLLLTDDTISLLPGEPFRLEVKVTHLTEGQAAAISLDGSFEVIDAIDTSATGTQKAVFNLFYPAGYTGTDDTLVVNVTVDGVTTSVPVYVILD